MKTLVRVMFAVLLFSSLQLAASEATEDPLERQVLDIAYKLRCTVCQNQPVAESHSGLAKDMRNIIREKLEQGQSEQEIMDFFVQRYGDYVLMEPPKSGNGVPLWVFPPFMLLIAALAAVVFMRSRRDATASSGSPTLSDEDRERVRRAREQDKDE